MRLLPRSHSSLGLGETGFKIVEAKKKKRINAFKNSVFLAFDLEISHRLAA
jgi:hypothetical protein